MWLLPLARSGASTSLPPGRYRVPWWYSDAQAEQLATLVARLVPDLEYRISVPWAALPLPSGRGLHQPHHTLVSVRVPVGVEPDDAEGRLQNLGGRYQLIQFQEPQDTGYGWQEQHLQEPLLSLIRRNLTDELHPLAAHGIANLPLNFAARLTSDMVELSTILADAIAHRLRYAQHGVTADDYRQSLRVVAGRRLAARLAGVPAATRPLAVALVLAGPQRVRAVEDPTAAARALQQVGLAHHVAGDISLGPLVRQSARDDVIRGAFLDGLDAATLRHEAVRAWTVDPGMMSLSGAPSPAAPLVVRRSGESLWHEVRGAVEQAIVEHASAAPLEVHAALRDAAALLLPLGAVPSYQDEVPGGVASLAIGRLRRLADLASRIPRELVQLHGVITALLEFSLARGPAGRAQREAALDAVARTAGDAGPPWAELAYGAMRAEWAWEQLATAADKDDIEAVRVACAARLARVPPGTAVAASLLGVEAHLVAKAGDNEAAREIHRRRIAIYEALGAKREAAVTEARIARLEAAAGDQVGALARHERALRVFEAEGARHDLAVSLGDIARLRANRGELREALKLHRDRLAILEELGARHSAAIAQGDVARLLAHRGDLDEALALHEARLAEFEALGEVVGQAIALGDIARIKARRGELDEALVLQRRRLATFTALDDLDGQAVTYLHIGQVEVQLGHLADAEVALRRAYALNQRVDHAEGIARSADELGRLLAARGDAEAGRLLDEAIAGYEKIGRDHNAAATRAVRARLAPRSGGEALEDRGTVGPDGGDDPPG